MNERIEKLKGSHPGLVLNHELRKRKIKKGKLALQVGEYPQTLGAITKGKRKFTAALALKIEKAMGFEEGYLMVLQAYYEVYEEKLRTQPKPDLKKFRRVVFWDTNFDRIDWEKNTGWIIRRVMTHGNQQEMDEITHFYGSNTIKKHLDNND